MFLCNCCKKNKQFTRKTAKDYSASSHNASNINININSNIKFTPSILNNNYLINNNNNNSASTSNIKPPITNTNKINTTPVLLNAINPSNYYQHIPTPSNKQRFFSITPKTIMTPKFMQPSNEVGIKYQSSKGIQNVIGDKLKCFFCGGFKCKYEDYTLNENQPNAIKGLHSNYIIEDSIIASQRLSSVLITNFNLIAEFKSINIGLIVNLQNPFEHAFCGPNANNMHKSGYAYDPNIFINEGITYISYGWSNDYDFKFILNIIKEIAKYINYLHKKVLIHCHAGYNRTGIIIGAYMMYMKSIYNEEEDNKGYIEIVNEIKMKRRKCLTRKEDVEYLKKIELNIKMIKELFGKHKQKIQIEKYLANQINLYYVLCFQQFNYQNIPLLIFLCFNKIIEIQIKYNISFTDIYVLFINNSNIWNKEYESILYNIKESINNNNWDLFDKNENLIFIKVLLFNWLEEYVQYIINPIRINIILNNDLYLKYLNNKDYYLSFNDLNELLSLIKQQFKKYEYDTIHLVAQFCYFINTNNKIQSYINFIDRICFALLGYDMNKKGITSNLQIQRNVIGLTSIVYLIIETFDLIYNNNNHNKRLTGNFENYINEISNIKEHKFKSKQIKFGTVFREQTTFYVKENISSKISNKKVIHLKKVLKDDESISIKDISDNSWNSEANESGININDNSKSSDKSGSIAFEMTNIKSGKKVEITKPQFQSSKTVFNIGQFNQCYNKNNMPSLFYTNQVKQFSPSNLINRNQTQKERQFQKDLFLKGNIEYFDEPSELRKVLDNSKDN